MTIAFQLAVFALIATPGIVGAIPNRKSMLSKRISSNWSKT